MIKRVNGAFDPESLNLEELMELVITNLNTLSKRFEKLTSDGDEITDNLTPEEEWVFGTLNDTVDTFHYKYCYY